ncbi:MAG TPA: hypothetical protein VI299_28635, partial [Polyangiales bacterium]
LTPYCWFGAALAGEYQHAVFSPFELVLNTLVWMLGLSLADTAMLLVLVHLAILSAGAFRLARAYGCTPVAAVVVAVVGSLNGWMMNWGAVNWYPALTSFSWLPWLWLALLQLLRSRQLEIWRVCVAGALLGTLLSAGWVFTVAMAGLVTAWLVLAPHRLRSLLVCSAVWLIGLGLASPALAMLANYGAETVRGEQSLSINRGMIVAVEGLLGMVLPAYRTHWNGFFSEGVRRSVELAGALVPVVCVSVGGRVSGQRALAVLTAIVALLMMSPALEGLRFSFRWLPLFHLTVALLGMRAWSLAPRASALPALVALVATLLVWARARLLDLDPGTQSMQLGAALSALALAWLLLSLLRPRWGALPMLAFVVGSLWLSYRVVPPNSEVQRWSVDGDPRALEPLHADVRYLSLWEWGDLLRLEDGPGGRDWVLATGGLRVGYTALFAGASMLHGYSPVGELALSRLFEFNIHAENAPGYVTRALHEASLGGGLLQLAAVDGLIVPPRYTAELAELEGAGWRRVARVPQGEVLHRATRSPRVRAIREALAVPTLSAAMDVLVQRSPAHTPSVLVDKRLPDAQPQSFAEAEVTLTSEQRLKSVAEVAVPAGGDPALVVFARPWLPGWKARLGDQKLRVVRYDGFLPGVIVPAGAHGTLVLRYFPGRLAITLWIAGVTLLLCLAASCWQLRKLT